MATTGPKGKGRRRTVSSITPEESKASALQHLWAEDYYSGDVWESFKNPFDNAIAVPAPATLTERPFPKSIPLSCDEEASTPRQTRKHQRSLTALIPSRTTRPNSISPRLSPLQRSPERSPVKEELDFDFMPTLTGDREGQINIEEKSRGRLSSWFSGSSASVAVGVPVPEFETSMAVTPAPDSVERPLTKLRKRQTITTFELPVQQKTPPAPTSRFAFFSSPKTPVKQTETVEIDTKFADEFLTLDIQSALFPSGLPSDEDPFSPSAFKNLLSNAEGLLIRLQTAYKHRTLSLHEVTAEHELQTDQLEEAETRATHWKLQLEDMAAKMHEQDGAMASLAAELMTERQARAEEKDARQKSIEYIKAQAMLPIRSKDEDNSTSEDFQVEFSNRRRQWRCSNATMDSQTSFESDDESAESRAESVFSRSLSPAPTDTTTPEVRHAVFAKVMPGSSGTKNLTQRPQTVQQKSTFQKMLQMGSEETLRENDVDEDDGCRNCRGGSATVAWDTVSVLRAENRGLKERVLSLDRAVEGALDLVAGLGS